MIQKITNIEKVKDLFAGWEETLIWSCMQGVMGEIYADDAPHPALLQKRQNPQGLP